MTIDAFELTGTVVDGSYRIDAVVGEGSYGVVYRGMNLIHMTPIAFKVLRIPSQLKAEDRPALLAKFEEEAESLIELSERHPAFVRVTEKGVLPASAGPVAPYLVMEWLNGETLEAEIAQRQATRSPGRSLDEMINLLTPIAEGLELAHLERIVHRNLSPSDVFLVDLPDGVVKAKLLDLGLARMMTALATVAPVVTTGAGFAMRYGAPEQWNRAYGLTGPSTDVYALALIGVELMTGKPALVGDEPGQFLGATIDPVDRPTPQSRGLDVPIGVELIFRQALAVMPKNRYPNAGLFWDALCDAAGSKALGPKSSQRPKLPPGQASLPPTSKPSEALAISAAAPAAPLSPRKGLPRALVASGLLIPLAAISLAFAFRGQPAPAEQGAASASQAVSAPEPSALAPPSAAIVEPSAAPSVIALSLCPDEMVEIPGGSFTMGSNDYADEKPVHTVNVASFCLDRTEVTAAAYMACVGKGLCRAAEVKSPVCNAARGDRQDHPMNCVDFPRADGYCRAQRKRLPTEEQWEYAARGGSERRTFPWGEKDPAEQLCWNRWNGTSALGTCAVGSHPEGDARWGVHDLSGNVWEWTDTWHCPDYSGARCPKKLHVVRGGSWSVGLVPFVRTSFRGGPAQVRGGDDVGFRCARAL